MNSSKILISIVLWASVLMIAFACQPKPPAPRLVILYATCTVNKDFLSPYNPEIRFTPNLEAFAQDAVVFTNHVTEAGYSGIAFASIFSGVHANIHGAYRHPFRLGNHLYQISEAYRDSGYETFFWSGHSMASYDLNYGQGVPKSNVYVASKRRRQVAFAKPEKLRKLTATHQQFANILKRLEQDADYKAFVQINFSITHAHYQNNASDEVQRRFLEHYPDEGTTVGYENSARLIDIYEAHSWQLQRNFPETVERLGLSDEDVRDLALVMEFYYKAGIFQLDEYFGRFVDSIREADLLDESLIAFTADHGEILYRENALYKWTHGQQLAPEVLNVPLILFAPFQKVRAGRYENVTRSIDVYPTMSALSSVPIPASVHMDGVDLSPALLGRDLAPDLIAFSHTSTVGVDVLASQKRNKLTLALKHFPRVDINLAWVSARQGDLVFKRTSNGSEWSNAVFDLSVDPGEMNNHYDPQLPEHQEMFEKLQTYKRLLIQGSHQNVQSNSPEDLENLRSLGYIGD